MERRIFSPEHDLFRTQFRRFVEREVAPNRAAWAEAGCVSREAWKAAGEAGFLCTSLRPEHGGAGADFLYSMIISEELARAHESGFGLALHSDIVVPYIANYGSDEQRGRLLRRCIDGDCITAIAMTEPGTGSDLAAIRTTATREGSDWVIDGTKTFVSNGQLADLVVVVAKTDPAAKLPHRAISLFLVEANTPGFARGRPLKKIGMASQDTSELFFDKLRVPGEALLGEVGAGMLYMMQRLQIERLLVAISAQAHAEIVLEETIAYTKERNVFGKPVASFQNTAFKLADCATKLEVGRSFLDNLCAAVARGETLIKECSMAKLWHTEVFQEVADTCLQFWGGYGLMLDYPVARAFEDARVQRIYAGTNEIMRMIIASQMGLGTSS